jgi:HK97 family phage portal protein
MGFFNSGLFGRTSSDVRLSDPYLAEFFSGRGIGSNVTPETALSNSSALGAVIRVRSEMLASIGLHLFARDAQGGRSRADDNPLYDVLHSVANPTTTAFEFRELMIRDLDLTGNCFAAIERNSAAQVIALYHLDPMAVVVEKLNSGRLRYKVSGQTLLQEEVLHVRGPSRDGILGQSPLTISRGVFGLALTQQTTAGSVAQNAVRTSGVMTFAEKLGTTARDAIRTSIQDFTSGGEKSGSVLVMDNDAKFTPLTISAGDAEFLASRKLSAEDVARLFGVPPTVIGITDKATYSNTEQEARALVQNALGPLAARIEAAMARCLLSAEERKALYVEHDLSSLLRGDVASRFEAYRVGREIGALSPNDIRKKENEPPIAGGDLYHYPSNWVPLGTVAGVAV